MNEGLNRPAWVPIVTRMASNAYRLLGTAAGSSRAKIRDTEGAIRRAAKLGLARTSEWDQAWLGPLDRSLDAVRDAVGRLTTSPSNRLWERVFWFQEGGGLVGRLALDNIKGTAANWLTAYRPAARHDGGLLGLAACSLLDPYFEDKDAWTLFLRAWREMVDDDSYWALMWDIEQGGGFEPAAEIHEQEIVRRDSLRAVAGAVSFLVKEAAAVNRVSVSSRATECLQQAEYPADVLSELEDNLFSFFEDKVDALCGDIREEHKVTCDGDKAKENRVVCDEATNQFYDSLKPLAEEILLLTGRESAVGRRIRGGVAACLADIAVGWTWANDFIMAEIYLQVAAEIGEGTETSFEIAEYLGKVAANARAQETFERQKAGQMPPSGAQQPSQSVPTDSPSPSATRSIATKAAEWVVIAVVGALAVFGIWSWLSGVSKEQKISDLKVQIDASRAQLGRLGTELDQISAEIDGLNAQLPSYDAQIKSFESKMSIGLSINRSSYLSAINSYNLLVDDYNSKIEIYRSKHDEYERARTELNAIINEYNDLIEK